MSRGWLTLLFAILYALGSAGCGASEAVAPSPVVPAAEAAAAAAVGGPATPTTAPATPTSLPAVATTNAAAASSIAVAATVAAVAVNSAQGTVVVPPARLIVQVRDDPQLGRILTDGSGRTVYRYDLDSDGTSSCTGTCVQTWRPLVSAGANPQGPPDLTGEIKTLNRSDGRRQVMHNARPLYLFAGDAKPTDTMGEGVDGVWHVVQA